ncbi:MAG: type II secretion system F family protein [Paludisphaera borealis]|uniref:type II secretion system F family protein n=1 Tax=Paludisphaera borealis TaxID=1387353 RepID=UPI0028438302|nr:type II secretion system F family protein [Paludisphaera borealis]MDR3622206.1 type II secretion system F family protein [Paludisphaera borealis]
MADSQEKPGGRDPLTQSETERLSDQIAGAARSGLPLGPGLRALGEELSQGGFRNSLIELADAIDRGSPLTTALEAQQDRIPSHIRGLVLGGLRTGKLGDVLGRFSAYASVGTELKRGLWLGLAYPLFTIGLAFTLLLLVDIFLVGQFENIFRDFGIPLPTLTILLVGTSHAARSGWPVLVTFVGLVVACWLILCFLAPTPVRNSIIGRIPVIGKLWRFTSWAEFCHLLAILLESELPMPEALRLTGQGIQNSDIDRACRAMANDVEQGKTLSEAMAGRATVVAPVGPFDHLDKKAAPAPPAPSMENLISAREGAAAVRQAMPRSLARLLQWAESHRAIAEILHMAGEMFEARSRSQAAFAGTVMGVLAVIGVILGIFIVVVGLMLPMITLLSKLSG